MIRFPGRVVSCDSDGAVIRAVLTLIVDENLYLALLHNTNTTMNRLVFHLSESQAQCVAGGRMGISRSGSTMTLSQN